MPTLEDVLPELTNAKVFSLLDAKDGFLQVCLSDQSSFLTTFWGPTCRFRWLRLPFGLSSAPEEFQRRLQAALYGIDGVVVVVDDILIYGRVIPRRKRGVIMMKHCCKYCDGQESAT